MKQKTIIVSSLLVILGILIGFSFSTQAEYKHDRILDIIHSNSELWNEMEKIQEKLNKNNDILRGFIQER